MKKKEEQLVRKVTDMIQKTREGKLHWDIQCQTTEYNDPAKKPVETEEGETWVIDECFVSYHCMDQEKNFYWFLMSRSTPAERKEVLQFDFSATAWHPLLRCGCFSSVCSGGGSDADLRSTYAVADRA